MKRFRPNVSAFLAASLAVASSGTIAQAAAPPSGLHAENAPGGGSILEGTVGGAGSPVALMRTALGKLRGTFDSSPDIVGVVRSNDGTLTVALFRAQLRRTPIGGLVLATYAAHGDSRVAIVYDRADRFAKSANGLIARVSSPPAGASGNPGPLRQMTSPDRSVSALVPPSWKIEVFSQGEFAATGPDGAEVDQEVSARLIDPRSPVYQQALQLQSRLRQGGNSFATPYGMPLTYTPDPAQAFVAFSRLLARAQGQADPNITIERTAAQQGQAGLRVTEIAGTQTVKGVRMRFDGIVGVTSANQNGAWMISVKMVAAPVAHFQSDLPTLVAVYNSYQVNQGVRHDQVQQTIADDKAGAARGLALMQQTQSRNTAVFNASMSHARSVQDSIDRSTAGFTQYLNGTTVVANNATGGHMTVGSDFAQSIIKNDPKNFSEVPLTNFRKGVDY